MSEERFVAIETRLDSVETKLDSMRQEMREMGQDLRRGMSDLGQELRGEMNGGLRDLGRQMRVLHEDVIDRIKVLAPDLEPIRREFRAEDANLKDEIDQRLAPLESALRKRP